MPVEPGAEVSERRVHPRFELLAQVRVRNSAIDYVLELSNVSRSGALLQLGTLRKPSWVAVGRMLDLSIIVPVDLDTVDVRGRIVRVQQAGRRCGFGVEFVSQSPHAAAGIERLIALGRPQPPPLPKAPPPLPMAGGDRRRDPRRELLAAVHARHGDEDYVLELRDISASGALVLIGTLAWPSWIGVGETVALSIIDPVDLDPVEVDARIVRIVECGRRAGFAVEFTELDLPARAGIAKLVARGRPQPPPLPFGA